MPLYLIQYAQVHLDFRIQELKALALLFQIQLDLKELNQIDLSHPFVTLTLPNDVIAQQWIQRSILAKAIYVLLDQATSYDELIFNMKNNFSNYKKYESNSFRFDVETFNYSRSLSEKVDLLNTFDFLPLRGPIHLKNPEIRFTIFEVYEKEPVIIVPQLIFFGVKIAESSRHILSRYALPKRRYLGTTSMDPELSFLMAQLALVKKGDLVYDPCVGTGSVLLACAHLGAYCLGSDMDGRTIRGIELNKNVLSNYQQYQLECNLVDHLVATLQHIRFRVPLCQAILTDPPYGIREQQKKHTVHIQDLFDFSFHTLVESGRLVFVWPYMSNEEKPIPRDPRFTFHDLCIQSFGKWERHIYVYSKNPLLPNATSFTTTSLVQVVEDQLQDLSLASDLPTSSLKKTSVKQFRDAYFKPRVEKKKLTN